MLLRYSKVPCTNQQVPGGAPKSLAAVAAVAAAAVLLRSKLGFVSISRAARVMYREPTVTRLKQPRLRFIGAPGSFLKPTGLFHGDCTVMYCAP